MNTLKIAFAAAILTVGAVASASAMPVGNIGSLDVGVVQAEQVRLVCNQWGQCLHVRRRAPVYGYYGYGSYGYGGGWGGGWHGGHHHHHH
jgi:hypothetical protein